MPASAPSVSCPQLRGGVEQGERAGRVRRGRVHPQCRPLAVVLDHLVAPVVLGGVQPAQADLRGDVEGVAQVPAVHREVVPDRGERRDGRPGATLPVVLDPVHPLPPPEERGRDLPPDDHRPEPLLEVPQQQFDVEREPARTAVERDPEPVPPAELVSHDGGHGQVGVEDGAALEALEQRVPDRDQPVRRIPGRGGLHRDAEGGIRHRLPRRPGDDHVVGDRSRTAACRYRIGHGDPPLRPRGAGPPRDTSQPDPRRGLRGSRKSAGGCLPGRRPAGRRTVRRCAHP